MQFSEAVAHLHSAQLSANLWRSGSEQFKVTVLHIARQGPIPSNDHRPTLQGASCGGDFLQLLLDCGSVMGALAAVLLQL